jgi:RimJ/RimL family protein N-acetyltransferase
MLVRLAECKDASDILRWRNDPLTRAMSRNNAPIGEQAHNAWFERARRNRDRVLLVGVVLGRPIGMVRFDRLNCTASWEINIALAPEERGKGMGKMLLALALSRFFATYPEATLLAEINQSNVVSRRLFESAGFFHESSDGAMLQFSLLLK